MDRHAHWEQVYRTKAPDQVSWFQAEATLSESLIGAVVADHDDPILDVGAGASVLVDGLLDEGYRNLTVLDIAAPALEVSRHRLGARASQVTWMAGDVLSASLAAGHFAVWHDRAVFHFLTDAADRQRYVAQVRYALRPGGFVVLATFAEVGPEKCSGLPVARYAPEELLHELGAGFTKVSAQREMHRTPSGATQAFTYVVAQRS